MEPFNNRNSDLTINIKGKGKKYIIYVLKRPFLEQFLLEISYLYEIIIFSESIPEYVEALIKKIDKYKVIKYIK